MTQEPGMWMLRRLEKTRKVDSSKISLRFLNMFLFFGGGDDCAWRTQCFNSWFNMAVQFMRIKCKIWIEVPRHHSTLRLLLIVCFQVIPQFILVVTNRVVVHVPTTGTQPNLRKVFKIYQFWLVRVPKFWCSVQISHLFVVQDSSTWRQPRASLRLQNQTNARFPGFQGHHGLPGGLNVSSWHGLPGNQVACCFGVNGEKLGGPGKMVKSRWDGIFRVIDLEGRSTLYTISQNTTHCACQIVLSFTDVGESPGSPVLSLHFSLGTESDLAKL